MSAAQPRSPTRSSAGFTLIELLVASAIMTLMVGLGIAGFLRFNERQQVKNSAKQIQTMMRTAQSRAQIREVPAGEDCELLGFRVSNVGQAVQLHRNCDDTYTLRDQYQLPSNITLEDTFDSVEFLTLKGGANLVSASGVAGQPELEIRTSDGDSVQYQFVVSASGTISEGSFVEN